MINVRLFEAFRAVIISGSVTEASKMLLRTQPSISRMIGELEEEIGTKLFERRNTRLVPTAEALRLFDEVEKSLAMLRQLDHFARNLTKPVPESVKVAVAPLFASLGAPRIFQEVRRLHPDVRISTIVRDPIMVGELVASGNADIGFAASVGHAGPITENVVCKVDLVCAMPPRHRLAKLQTVNATDLDGEDFVGFNDDVIPRFITTAIVDEAGGRPNTWIDTQRSHAAYGCVAAGLGVALLEPISSLSFTENQVIIRRFEPKASASIRVYLRAGVERNATILSFVNVAQEVGRELTREIERRLDAPAPV